jgi:Fic family protein
VRQTADDAAATAQRIHGIREDHRRKFDVRGATINDLSLLDHLFTQPPVSAKWVADQLHVTTATANAILSRFVKVGALREVTGRARNRVFRFDEYLALFDQPTTDRVHDETGSA